MLKHKAEQISMGVKLLDIVICIFAFSGAYVFREQVVPNLPGSLGQVGYIGTYEGVSWLLAASLALHFAIYPYFGFYSSIRQSSPACLISMALKALVVELLTLGAMVFLFQQKGTSRYFLLLYLAANYAFVIASRLAAWTILSAARNRGYNFRKVLIVGTGQNAHNVFTTIVNSARWGYVAAGFLKEERSSGKSMINSDEIIGSISEMEIIIRSQAIDEVVFATDYLDAAEFSFLNSICFEVGIPARYALSFFKEPIENVRLEISQNIPFLSFYRATMSPLETIVKRMIDILTSFVGLTITAAIFPLLAFKIKSQSPGPVLFSQPRVGRNGKIFTCYKFRSMDVEASTKKSAPKNEMDGPIFKDENDPRIFPLGRFLRKTSIDEFPQFWNILMGDMSLVGTRPPLIEEVEKYRLKERRRLSIKPGLTGLWQVNGRSNIKKFEDIVALDLHYIDNWSLWLDLKIIAKTFRVVLLREGAY